jgi:hypothetical protein
VGATSQSDGEQGAQSDRNAPHELHAESSSQCRDPPPAGGLPGLSGVTRPGDKPRYRGTARSVETMRADAASLAA